MTQEAELNDLKRRTGENPSKDIVVSAFGDMQQLLTRLEQLVVPEKLVETNTLTENFERFAVQTSLIGQVKAGKTALSNALLAMNGLLPSDVNPWTSVVTSVHLNQQSPNKKTAIFRFFSRSEWDGMVETGGRIAAMAQKADFDTEVEDMRAQIIDMQERTVERLGKNFELLLDNQHAFSEYDGELIRRYVCLGEDGETQEKEGRFADLTRSADLYSDSAAFDYPITIVDTPGVNDPFLVREAVTLDNLGKADICVIVLSAHQALSTSDLALMRILINLKQEQIVLFINRIDELSDPAQQLVEIHDGVRETLKRQKLPNDIPVIFGSAAWADAALADSLDDLPDDSLEALQLLRASTDNAELQRIVDMKDLSGMTALQAVLDEKAIAGLCAPFLTEVAISASNLALQSRAVLAKTIDPKTLDRTPIDIKKTEAQIDRLRNKLTESFAEITDAANNEITFAMSGIFHEFIFQEGRSLASFINGRDNLANWDTDTEALRRDLNGAYNDVTKDMAKKVAAAFRLTYETLLKEYETNSELSGADIGLSKPNFPAPDTPTSLMRTMTFDLSESWVSSWILRRIKKDAYLERFKNLASEQMHSILIEIQEKHISSYCNKAKETLDTYIEGHLSSMRKLADLDSEEGRISALKEFGSGKTVQQRVFQLDTISDQFETMIEDLNARIGEDRKKSA